MYFDKTTSLDQYLRKLSGQDKDSLETICDHNYVKHWSSHAGSERTKPARMLFMATSQRSDSAYICSDDEIDVVNDIESPAASPFDSQRTKILANELEHSLKSNLNNDTNGSELEDFPIENYSPQRRKIAREFMEVINADILAKTVHNGRPNEFIQRKIVTERCARQLRIILANTFYDFDIILWIHQFILDKGTLSTVTSYLNILQALRTKIPSIVDRIIKSYSGKLGYGYLNQILKKHWDPCVPVLNQHKPKKLPRNPLLIMNCAGFNLTKAANESPRFHFWTNHLNALCKTIQIPMKYSEDGSTTFGETIEDMLLALRSKITEFKNHYPYRPVILAGWTIGALISCQTRGNSLVGLMNQVNDLLRYFSRVSMVALETEVDAVICFGFSLTGVNGSRGGLDDPLLDSRVPTLFIIGQNSNMCSIDDVEDFRSRMKAVSGLVVVGGADDLLNISPQKMLMESITQEVVDRCILDEISNFLESCLIKSQPGTPVMSNNSVKTCPPIREESPDIINPEEVGKRKRRRPKEYSPELISSRKKSCHNVSKEIPSASTRSHLPTHSSRSSRKGRHHLSKTAKTSPDKKSMDRPLSGTTKKKIPDIIKSITDVPKGENQIIRTFKPDPKLFTIPPPEEPAPRESKPAIPFALNILPKKNVPVDVEKAFGSDSSFLPRPLTPPEPEDNTISAEETENTLGELEANSVPSSTVASEIPSTSFTPQIITISEKPSILSPEQKPSPNLQDSKTISGSIIKHVLTSTSDATKLVTVSAASSGIKTVFLKDRGLTSSPGSHIKSLADGSFVARTISQVKSPNAPKTMITVPLNAGPLLVSGQTLKTPSGKIFQFLSKSPISAQSKETLTPKLVGSTSHESTQQIYNVSSLNDMPKKITTTSSSATLVKLAVPDKAQNLKHIQVIKPSQARPESTKVETAAEMIEKQLAIQSLNESVGLESSREGPTSYTKPATSIISRVVPRSGHPPYIRQSIIAHPPIRGRMRPILPNKIYQMYPK